MPSIYSPWCSVCGAPKRVRVKKHDSDNPQTFSIRNESWGYASAPNEFIVEAYCSECGIKFALSQ